MKLLQICPALIAMTVFLIVAVGLYTVHDVMLSIF